MNWHFEEGTHINLQEAVKNAFYELNGSGLIDLGHKYNWIKNGRDHWGYDFRKIGEYHNDRGFYWDIELQTRGGIMQSVEKCSTWCIRVEKKELCCFERKEFAECKCAFKESS